VTSKGRAEVAWASPMAASARTGETRGMSKGNGMSVGLQPC
jgi:hypothetical protein